jgi:hypothetical protein
LGSATIYKAVRNLIPDGSVNYKEVCNLIPDGSVNYKAVCNMTPDGSQRISIRNTNNTFKHLLFTARDFASLR